MRFSLRILYLVSLSLYGCKSPAPQGRSPEAVKQHTVASAKPQISVQAELRERAGTGVISYLGYDLDPAEPKRGQKVTLSHYFQVKSPFSKAHQIFLHGDLPGGAGRALVGDHAPIDGKVGVQDWKAGEIWKDRHQIQIPRELATGSILLHLGLFKGADRALVAAKPGINDGRNRMRIGRLKVAGAAPNSDLPISLVKKTSEVITPDGKLDEPAWQGAEVLTFRDTMGRNPKPRFPTKLRLLFDNKNLYVAFESVDEDITERYKKRDDPIYEHETVELFLMPEVQFPELGPYVELQASPTGVIFDASFDGRRIGMNTRYNAGQTVGTVRDGSLDTLDKDRGWVSEWVVPFSGIRGLSKPVKVGDEWRMNAFRIEKYRVNGKTQGEYTAWSPPMVGDFHNIVRFGRMRFVAP